MKTSMLQIMHKDKKYIKYFKSCNKDRQKRLIVHRRLANQIKDFMIKELGNKFFDISKKTKIDDIDDILIAREKADYQNFSFQSNNTSYYISKTKDVLLVLDECEKQL